MHSIERKIEIDGSSDRVWQVLTDFERYGEWNSFFRRICGELHVGACLDVTVHTANERATTSKVRVRRITEGRELRWSSGIRGVFSSEHTFLVEPLPERGKTIFIQREEFGGVVVSLFWARIREEAERCFDNMNEALRQVVESKHHVSS